MRLQLKFFFILVLLSILIIVLMAGIMHFLILRNFAEFRTKSELLELTSIIDVLKESYIQNDGWDKVRGVQRWHLVLQQAAPENQEERLKHNQALNLPAEGLPAGVMIPQHGRRFPPTLHAKRNTLESPHTPPLKKSVSHLPPFPPLPHRPYERAGDLLNLASRLCLLDENRMHVSGHYVSDGRYVFQEITVDKTIIGFLGLQLIERRRHPLEIEYLASQKQMFWVLGGGIFLLSTLLAHLLARQLIRPIRQLMKGTETMQRANFDVEIDVVSNDELGDLAKNFNAMARTLKQYEQMRKQWLSDISHELRTPISVLRAKIEAVQDGIRKMTPEMLGSLHHDVLRLTQLVEDLHILSITDSEGLSLSTESVNPVERMQACVDSFRIECENKQIELALHINDDGPISFQANRDSIYRLFSNLMTNSLRYTDSPGHLVISISKSTSNPANDKEGKDEQRLIVKFEDSAPGVPDDALHRIFDRLYRVDKSRSRALGGSGLGLSICKQIVSQHQGIIRADHAPLGGLAVIIEIPLKSP